MLLTDRIFRSDVILEAEETQTIFDIRLGETQSHLYTLSIRQGIDKLLSHYLHDLERSTVVVEYGMGSSTVYKEEHRIGAQGLVLTVSGTYLKVTAHHREPARQNHSMPLKVHPINIQASLTPGVVQPHFITYTLNPEAGDIVDAGEWYQPVPPFACEATLSISPEYGEENGAVVARQQGIYLDGVYTEAGAYRIWQFLYGLEITYGDTASITFPISKYTQALVIDASGTDQFPRMMTIRFKCMA